ncbi:MAG TPA: transglycosylase domain-containing protein, partial [Patescibacteria group bacterium]|nr:transglycosylase domain-containing protein [Patescibacteria group bacterium]
MQKKTLGLIVAIFLAPIIGAWLVLNALIHSGNEQYVAMIKSGIPVYLSKVVGFISADGIRISGSGSVYGKAILNNKDIPQNVWDSVCAAEDRKYPHSPVYTSSLIRYALGGKGVSSVQQQYCKFLQRDPATGAFQERSITNKLAEMRCAVRAAKGDLLNKRDLMLNYLNVVYLGSPKGVPAVTGYDAGAWVYFGKKIDQLTDYEAAFLTGLFPAPAHRDPFGTPEQQKLALSEMNRVIRRMQTFKPEKYGHLKEQTKLPKFADPQKQVSNRYNCTNFTDWVCKQDPVTCEKAKQATVRTTLNYAMQKRAMDIMNATIKRLGNPNLAGSIVALNAYTGDLLVYANTGTFDIASLGIRNVGSQAKSFALAMAMEAGQSPLDEYWDVPRSFGDYTPGNAGQSRGRIPMWDAFRTSQNIAHVAMMERCDCDFGNFLQDLGFSGATENYLSYTLGAFPSNTFEMAKAYAVFVNFGNRIVVPKYLNAAENKAVFGNVFNERYAASVSSMMGLALQFGTGERSWENFLNGLPGEWGSKTGSTEADSMATLISGGGLVISGWFGNPETTDETKLYGSTAAMPAIAELAVFMVSKDPKLAGNFRRVESMEALETPYG